MLVYGAHTLVRSFQPNLAHPSHRDGASRVSILLRGDVAEDSAWGAARLRRGDVLFKSREVVHEDRFGPDGAGIFSVIFNGSDDCPFEAAQLDGAWMALRSDTIYKLGLTTIEAAAANDKAGLQVAIADLLVCAAAPRGENATAPWLIRLYRALQEVSLAEFDVGADARSVGVHPVTMSRSFRRRFGMSVTEHAARQSVRRALVAMARGDTDLAAVAVSAGFYDQSHMTRVFRRVTGKTPGQHRTMLATAS